jgi:hypothetical protein
LAPCCTEDSAHLLLDSKTGRLIFSGAEADIPGLRYARYSGNTVTVFLWVGMAHERPQMTDEKLGTVHFSTSCNGAAQSKIDRAVALLHSFQFGSAVDTFEEALKKD